MSAHAIAIVGLGCRFPGAPDPAAFWALLEAGVDAIRAVPRDRWDHDAWFDPEPNRTGKMITPYGGFLDAIDRFDADFFEMDAREARRVDPQQRLMLEVAWEALEHAGIVPARLAGSTTGVFIGMRQTDYNRYLYGTAARIDGKNPDNTYPCIVANRLSYLLDLRGPSLAVDTACSSSLVSVHLACRSLRSGETDLAIAGGVNLNLFPEESVSRSLAGMVSPTGRCRAFDASADGYVIGEGCGAVVLKRLADAEAEGDRILAVIRGSAVNHNGLSYRMTAYNGRSQQTLLRDALDDAGVAPEAIGYVEANGSASPLGDPIELKALRAVLAGGPDRARCWIGSVKTNIGHLEGASGIASLIKTVLALQHEAVPSHLHLQTPNPADVFDGSALAIATRCEPWPRGTAPRIAGVSAFGLGGANAHMIVAEAPLRAAVPSGVERPGHVLALSARSEAALEALVERYAAWLARRPDGSLADLCHTANTGRTHHRHRVALVADSIDGLRAALRAPPVSMKIKAKRPKVAFIVRAAAAVSPDVVRVLRETQPAFDRAWLQQADAPSAPARFAAAQRALWQAWGIVPDAVLVDAASGDIATLVGQGVALFIEIGPAASDLPAPDVPTWLAGPQPGHVWPPLLAAVAALHVHGAPIDWAAFDAPYPARRRIDAPTYPFQRQHFPLDATSTADAAPTDDAPLDALLAALLAPGAPDLVPAGGGAAFEAHLRKLTGEQVRDLLGKATVLSSDKDRRMDAAARRAAFDERVADLDAGAARRLLAELAERQWQRDALIERYVAAALADPASRRSTPDQLRAALLFVSERLRRKEQLLQFAPTATSEPDR
ncbi:MAG: hypothetical protein JSR59_16555 [Proteobacteria bacterium]|nr:hypothetical protein [Pseudomonadota bacterium]